MRLRFKSYTIITYIANKDLVSGQLVSKLDFKTSKIEWPFFKCYVNRRGEHEGLVTPWWLGHSYYDWDRDVKVYYIVPVNLVVAAWRALAVRIKFIWPHKLNEFEERVADTVKQRILDESPNHYSAGYRNGYGDGFIDGGKVELEKLKEYQKSLRNKNG